MTKQTRKRPFSELMGEITSGHILPEGLAEALSEPSEDDLNAFFEHFEYLIPEYQKNLLNTLVEQMELDFLLDYSRLGTRLLNRTNPLVRVEAINLLWFDQSKESLSAIHSALRDDASLDVKIAAATSLGRYVLWAELGDFPIDEIEGLEETLISIWTTYDEDPELRRRALESISYASREDIPSYIEEAYSDVSREIRISAILAMGRHGDEALWSMHILNGLEDENDEIRFESAHAAGEMMLDDAIPLLIHMVNEEDIEIKLEVIWALGEIGGDEARSRLLHLQSETDDDDVLEAIDEALSILMLGDGDMRGFDYHLDSTDPSDEDRFLDSRGTKDD